MTIKTCTRIAVVIATLGFWILTLSLQKKSFSPNSYLLVFQILVLLIHLWARFTLGRANQNLGPEPISKIVKTGPYRFVDHPIYLTFIVFWIPPVLESGSFLLLIVWASMTMAQIARMSFEDEALER